MKNFLLFLIFVFGPFYFSSSAQNKKITEQWYNQAVELQNTGKYAEAIALYTKVIEAGGFEVDYYNRANCYFLTDETQKGFEDLKKEQQKLPNYAPSFSRYGYYTMYFSDSTKGLDYIRKALEIDSLDYFSWMAGALFFGVNLQKDSMIFWDDKALNCLIDSGDIDQMLAQFSLFSPERILISLEKERIEGEYKKLYFSYITANQYFHDIFYYKRINDGEKVIDAAESMYLYERETIKPRRFRMYYALNYFHTLGQLLYKSGNFNIGKIFLDYENRIADDIGENEAFAMVWSDKAYMYFYKTDYDSSIAAYNEYFRHIGKPDSTTASIYATLVVNYCGLSRYDSAEKYAMLAEQYSSKKDYAVRSVILNNLGYFYSQVGNYTLALANYSEAAAIATQLKDTFNLTLFLNNIGSVYQADGRYDKAEEYFFKAKAINQSNAVNLVAINSNLGYLHTMWGNYKKAIMYFKEALPQAIEYNLYDKMGLIFNNMSICYRSLKQPDEAGRVIREAVALFEKVKSPDLLALGYLNLGNLFSDVKNLDSALYFYNKSLEINLKLNKVTELGMNYDNLASVYFLQQKYPEAVANFLKAIEYDEASGRKDRLAAHYGNIGTLYLKQKDYSNGETYFKKCISLFEEIRKTATGEVRREYFVQVITNYQLLSLAQIAQEHYADAFETMELSKAKLLGEQLSIKGEEFKLVSLAEVQQRLDDSTAVYFFNSISDEIGYGFLIDKKNILPLKLKDEKLFSGYSDLMKMPDTTQVSLEQIINHYRNLLLIPELAKRSSSLLTDSLSVVSLASPEQREKVAKLLYNYFFSGIAVELLKYRKLIIVPDGIANFLPFESLIDSNNHYLAETMSVGYIQSMSVGKLIAERKYSNSRKPMIAFGGAEYVNNSSKVVLKTTEAREAAKKNASSVIASRGNLSDSYTKLGYGSWKNLPGTIVELQLLHTIIPDCDIYEGKDVDESKIKLLSIQGKLKNYKVIHFATHGMVVPEIPELSALVLSQTLNNTKEDNYLRADEISRLVLNADFVALSACETGLGKIYNGDGVVGLTQSFMIAGANSLAVSLWQVADQSTSQFMSGIYKIAILDGNYMEAIGTMKRKFISGDYGEKYKAPYYWAPFIYYGKF